jgi:iron complex outermembrane receptor protein
VQINLGVRDPHFSRDLNQYCYTSVTSGSGVYCDSAPPPATGSTAQYSIAPFHAHVSYTKVLPNVGLSFHFDPANMIYASYSEELSAPRTDDLYTVSSAAGSVTLDTVHPETSTNYEVGYRFQRSDILASVALWDSEFQNRIVSSYDPNTNLTIDRNVGNVRLYGVDAQIGAKPIEHLATTAFFGYEKSRVEQNIAFNTGTAAAPVLVYEPLQGKELIETPEIELGGRVQYEFFPGATIGLQGKYVGSRWVTDVNDLKVPGYTTFDLDMRYDLSHFFPRSYIQFNATNILNKRYYGSLNSAGSIDTSKPWGGSPYFDEGAPRTATVTIRAAF